MPRAVIYARYSSDNQSAASIEDQIRLCKERLAAEGWSLEQVYRDAAMSGASALRPGYQAILEGAREGMFDIVIAEALDRLSRDQEDVASLLKRLRFAGIKLFTLAEGEINELHVGLKGTMNALFLKDLADKTRRGLRGRIEAGKSAGGRAYGYRPVRRFDAAGHPVAGDLIIEPGEALIVQRIFAMFADGESPLAIAQRLNAQGVAGPSGEPWRDTTIRGHANRQTGILRNRLYIGERVWNRMRYIKDPATGKRVSRMNPQTAWVYHDQPTLRIIEQDVWERVQARLETIRAVSGADRPDRPRFWERRRAEHVLTGKVHCAACGAPLTAVGKDYYACGRARRQGLCSNTTSIRRTSLETLILDALRSQLMAPELVAEFAAAFTAEWNRLAGEQAADRSRQERALETVNRKIQRLIDAILDGTKGASVQATMDALEADKARLEKALAQPAAPVPRLHPNLSEVYRRKVATLNEALADQEDSRAALEIVRGLIERVNVGAVGEDGKSREIELIGDLASMLRLAHAGEAGRDKGLGSDLFAGSVKVVAGRGFEPLTFRL